MDMLFFDLKSFAGTEMYLEPSDDIFINENIKVTSPIGFGL